MRFWKWGWPAVAAVVLSCHAGSTVAMAASANGPQPAGGLRDCPGGGFILPGSTTCVRLDGAVRSDLSTGTRLTGRSLTRLGTAARVDMDVRTPTELGQLRVFTSVRSRSTLQTQR